MYRSYTLTYLFIAIAFTSVHAQEKSPEQLAVETASSQIVYGPGLPRSNNLWNAYPAVTLVGNIEKLDNQVVQYIDAQAQRRKLPSDRIERIDVAWESEAAAAAHARFAKRQYLEVLKNNDEVLRAGGFPKWQQLILLSEIVQSFEAVGKPDAAGKYFLILAGQAPPDFLMATVPLNWTSREVSPAMAKVARAWLDDKDETAALMGASWLLLTEQGDAAKQRLQKLQTSSNKVLARMAAVQLWRATTPTETTGRINKWIDARDSLSLPMQLGPSEFLAERLSRIDRPALAIGEWLRIAAIYEQLPHRATLALDAAQERLSRVKTTEQSTQIQSAAAWRSDLNEVQ